jgi:hypothetical protein
LSDNDKTLIQQVLQSAGKAGEQGFAYLVHWQFIDGVTSFVGFAIALVMALWGLRIAYRWRADNEDGFEDEVSITRWIAISILWISAFGFLCGMQSGLRDMLAPEGTAIYVVLHH